MLFEGHRGWPCSLCCQESGAGTGEVVARGVLALGGPGGAGALSPALTCWFVLSLLALSSCCQPRLGDRSLGTPSSAFWGAPWGRWGQNALGNPVSSWGRPEGLGGRRRGDKEGAASGRGSWQGFGWRGRAWQGRQHPSTALGGLVGTPWHVAPSGTCLVHSPVSAAPLQLESAECQLCWAEHPRFWDAGGLLRGFPPACAGRAGRAGSSPAHGPHFCLAV